MIDLQADVARERAGGAGEDRLVRGGYNAVWSKTAWNNLVRSYKPAMGAFPNSMLRIGR